MPRIRDDFLRCVFYLYPSARAAEEGQRTGGTGFFVTAPIEADEPGHDAYWHAPYAVTNAHVINGGNLYVRANTRDGKVNIIRTEDAAWLRGPNGADFAILRGAPAPETHEFHTIRYSSFLTREVVDGWDIGPGDDIFFVGRFVNHEGRQKNTPSVRFGNIAMMPGERIKVSGISAQESYLIEARSIPGYSGSPVFVYIPTSSPRPYVHQSGKTLRNLTGPADQTYLLGIDWCHTWDRHRLEREEKPGVFSEARENLWARQNTMMMGVIPAYLLADLLMSDEMKATREKTGKRVVTKNARASAADDAARPQEHSITRDEFAQVLKRASQRPSPHARGKKGT